MKTNETHREDEISQAPESLLRDLRALYGQEADIPREVDEASTARFYWRKHWAEHLSPKYLHFSRGVVQQDREVQMVAANALTIGMNVGELRALRRWIDG